MLLLLDNFEQVAAAGPGVADLLASCPRLKVLVTSRAVLHLRGEHEFPVSPLSVPDPKRLPPLETLSQYAAVQLFIERALAVRADFAVTNENAPAVAAICHRLDGLPLAIELAAARTKLLSPQALLARLDSRLKLLVGGARDLPARHQTLRGAIAWSYELLEEREKRLFRRLSVFAGGCSPAAVEAVCDAAGDLEIDVWDGLASLVDNSLLGQEEAGSGAGDAETRFVMLETVREFAGECLNASGECEAVRQHHAQFFLGLAEEAKPHLRLADKRQWLARLQLDRENWLSALRWAVERGALPSACEAAELGLLLGEALLRYWLYKGSPTEGRQWLEHLLALPGGAARNLTRGRALRAAGALARQQGDRNAARDLFEESLTIGRELGDQRLVAQSLLGLMNVACYRGHFEAALRLGEECESLSRELGDRFGLQIITNNLGNLARFMGDYERAQALLQESLAISRELGNGRPLSGHPFVILGGIRLVQGDQPGARAYYDEAVAVARELDDQHCLAIALAAQGRSARYEGDWETAHTRLTEALLLNRAQGNRTEATICLSGLACVATGRGNEAGSSTEKLEGAPVDAGFAHAARLFGAAEGLRQATGFPIWNLDRAEHDRCLAAARTALGEAAFTAAWDEGRGMTFQQACDYALQELEPTSPTRDAT